MCTESLLLRVLTLSSFRRYKSAISRLNEYKEATLCYRQSNHIFYSSNRWSKSTIDVRLSCEPKKMLSSQAFSCYSNNKTKVRTRSWRRNKMMKEKLILFRILASILYLSWPWNTNGKVLPDLATLRSNRRPKKGVTKPSVSLQPRIANVNVFLRLCRSRCTSFANCIIMRVDW